LASCIQFCILLPRATMMLVATLLLTFLAQTFGTNCDQSAITAKSTTCISQMTSNIGGGVCNAWNGYVCCLKDAFAGCNMDAQIDTIVNSMKTTYSGQPGFAEISNCGAATCSGGSSGAPAAPSPVDTLITAKIEVSDPTTFNVNSYLDAVKNKTGSSQVTVDLKRWEVTLEFSVPDATTKATLKVAIAKTMGIAESSIIEVVIETSRRRLGDKRRLAANAAVTVAEPEASKANQLMTDYKSSANVNNLGTELGGSVTATKATAKAKVETTVSTEPSKVGALTTQLEDAGSDLGFTVTATVGTSMETEDSSNSNWSFLFAPLLILLTNMIQ